MLPPPPFPPPRIPSAHNNKTTRRRVQRAVQQYESLSSANISSLPATLTHAKPPLPPKPAGLFDEHTPPLHTIEDDEHKHDVALHFDIDRSSCSSSNSRVSSRSTERARSGVKNSELQEASTSRSCGVSSRESPQSVQRTPPKFKAAPGSPLGAASSSQATPTSSVKGQTAEREQRVSQMRSHQTKREGINSSAVSRSVEVPKRRAKAARSAGEARNALQSQSVGKIRDMISHAHPKHFARAGNNWSPAGKTRHSQAKMTRNGSLPGKTGRPGTTVAPSAEVSRHIKSMSQSSSHHSKHASRSSKIPSGSSHGAKRRRKASTASKEHDESREHASASRSAEMPKRRPDADPYAHRTQIYSQSARKHLKIRERFPSAMRLPGLAFDTPPKPSRRLGNARGITAQQVRLNRGSSVQSGSELLPNTSSGIKTANAPVGTGLRSDKKAVKQTLGSGTSSQKRGTSASETLLSQGSTDLRNTNPEEHG